MLVEFLIENIRRTNFICHLEIRFKFECSTITPSTLWDTVNLKNEDYTSNKCESRKGMTIIFPTSCESPKKNPITFKCKSNESFDTT